MADEKELLDVYRVLCTYLLYEKQEETEIRTAFSVLAQERHTNFHDKEGKSTDFTQCNQEICILALKMLQTAKEMKVELNDFSVQLIKHLNLVIKKQAQTRTCVAFLEELSKIEIPEQKDLIMKV